MGCFLFAFSKGRKQLHWFEGFDGVYMKREQGRAQARS